MTGNFGIGFRGVGAGLTLHPKISERVLGHLSFNGLWVPWMTFSGDDPLYRSFSGSVGFGVEVPTDDWSLGKPINQFLLAALLSIIINSAGPLYGLPVVPPLSAACTYWLGKKYYSEYERGSFWWSVGGAYAGALLGTGTFLLVDNNSDSETLTYISAIGGGLMIPLGAVLGYNLSRNSSSDFGFNNSRFDLPSIGLRPEKTDDGKTITAVDFKLINARF